MTWSKRDITAAVLATLIGATVPFAGQALAMGGGSDDSSSVEKSSTSSAGSDYIEAQRKVQAMDYDGAIPLLQSVLKTEPGNADALNYLGYSYRKLGNTSKALSYYLQALANEPEHLGANEYLGELYLEMGNLAKAEERLTVLQRACSGCMEEDELEDKIAAFKQQAQG